MLSNSAVSFDVELPSRSFILFQTLLVQNLVAAVAADARSIVVIAREHVDTYVETCSRLLRSDVSYSLPLGPVTSHAGAVAKYCGEHICLSVREDISGTARAIFANFSVRVAYGRGSVLHRQGDEIPRGGAVFFSSQLTMHCITRLLQKGSVGKGVMGVHSAGEV